MDKLPKLYKSRKFHALLGLICYLGLRESVHNNASFSLLIVLLFMGMCSSMYSVYALTKHKGATK